MARPRFTFYANLPLASIDPAHPPVIIRDGASYHRSQKVQAEAARLGLQTLPLPGYSLDLNPIEGLWPWMREAVTQLYCHTSPDELRRHCLDFIESINRQPCSRLPVAQMRDACPTAQVQKGQLRCAPLRLGLS